MSKYAFLLLVCICVVAYDARLLCKNTYAPGDPLIQQVKIGVSWTGEEHVSQYEVDGLKYLKLGVDVFEAWASSRSFCLDADTDEEKPFEFVFHRTTDDKTETSVKDSITSLIEDDQVDFIVGGYGTDHSLWTQEVTESREMLMVATSVTSANFNSRDSKLSFSSFPFTSVRIASMIPMYRVAGVRTATIVRPIPDPDPRYVAAADTCIGIEDALRRSFINEVNYVNYCMLHHFLIPRGSHFLNT